MNSEIITPDIEFEQKLRPSRFSDFTGQDKIRERLELFVQAAKERNDVLDHVLLCGPPGLGKTTLSYILADAMDSNIKCTSGPVIDKPSDLAGLLTGLERGDVLFIDEIHRMQRSVEEYLYSAMEDFVIDIVIDLVRTPPYDSMCLLSPSLVLPLVAACSPPQCVHASGLPID